MNKKSLKLYARAKKVIPGGVNSPVRAFLSVNQKPFFVKKAHGQYLVDEDNNKIIDYIGSWGAQILGHGHSKIKNTLTASLRKGITYGAPCSREVELAERITKIYPSINKVRMVSSGTEATMSAIRLARGYTGRNKILKFNGCYHGHGDSFLIKAGSGAATFGVPNSLGVPPGLAKETISTNFNDIESVKKVVKKYKLACIIVEPIAGNMNFIRSDENFLHELRTICSENDIVLIFDEVMTGFRVALGGAQSLYSIKPDLTTLGKVLGGGLPVGAFGGKSKIMNQLSPDGGVYQAGTLSGNPLAMDAGLKTLDLISKRNYFKNLEKITRQLTDGINELSRKYNKKIYADSQGGMFGIYFTDKKVVNYESISKSDIKKFIQFFKFMLKNKIYFAPSAYEAGFVSSAHTANNINYTLDIFEKWIKN
ncbi:MAG: glutamate-1-semialdehyde 2,1-aminomutase [Pseudomonadota bacterium]|jgi:glutamate-1-semialdehyde 2,1-aminomutase|nr:glutamate-1-semialdehyde-2,1-aminomutase [Gammaproteobacteria bacterium]MEC8085766.1 glutamate-1-semialdehyde 2,1-aminomutase [Pseudomonadota bacterium]|tara:strand:+ start:1426 stop:2697 length:1272 start_codon:yes stop_codon:yes gene_type:complete